MGKIFFSFLCCFFFYGGIAMAAENNFETDKIKTSQGDLVITCIGHGTLMIAFGGKIIHVDPVSQYADYTKLPKADLILITHEHPDHLDLKTIDVIKSGKTSIVATENVARQLPGSIILKNGDEKTVMGLKIEAVPAYNLVNMRNPGIPYHSKGIGNGYILTLSDKRLYIAGDTENIPEMKNLRNIDIAFLPMNLPYTMTPEMVADAVKVFGPKIIYPYHYGKTDVSKLIDLLKNEQNTEVRIRNMM
jgi:L-ascorbate metabolism protein UlaG (beta-lactamase superfamily)